MSMLNELKNENFQKIYFSYDIRDKNSDNILNSNK